MIVISSLQLMLESPLKDQESTMMKVLKWMELFYVVVFVLEALVKIIAHGFLLNGESSYLR